MTLHLVFLVQKCEFESHFRLCFVMSRVSFVGVRFYIRGALRMIFVLVKGHNFSFLLYSFITESEQWRLNQGSLARI